MKYSKKGGGVLKKTIQKKIVTCMNKGVEPPFNPLAQPSLKGYCRMIIYVD